MCLFSYKTDTYSLVAKKVLIIYSAKNNSPFYTHSAKLYNTKLRDLSAISRKSWFWKAGLIFTDVVPVCSTSVLAANKCIWKFKRQLLYIQKPQIGVQPLVRSFICSTVSSFIYFFLMIFIYPLQRYNLFVQSTAIFFLQAAMGWRSMYVAWHRAIETLPDWCRCIHLQVYQEVSLADVFVTQNSGWFWLDEVKHTVMRNYGVPGVELPPCPSSCLSIARVSCRSCMTFPSNPGSHHVLQRQKREAHSPWDIWSLFFKQNLERGWSVITSCRKCSWQHYNLCIKNVIFAYWVDY